MKLGIRDDLYYHVYFFYPSEKHGAESINYFWWQFPPSLTNQLSTDIHAEICQ